MEQERRDYKTEREEKSRNLIKDFEDLVNRSADSEAMHDQFKRAHRTLQQSMFREILGFICMIAKMDDVRDIDGRNEQSKEIAKKLLAGYAEIIAKEELERMKMAGYNLELATAKAEVYRLSIIEKPEMYLELRFI